MLDLILISVVSSFGTYLFVTEIVLKRFPKLGIVGKDVHKPNTPTLPEMGGMAFLFGLIVYVSILSVLGPLRPEVVSIFLSTMIAGAIGIIDDLRNLGKRTKPLLTMLSAIPLIMMGTTQEYLILPLGISFRIPTLYKLIAPIALAVTCNAINMFDVMNGVATGTSLLTICFLILAGLARFFMGGNINLDALTQVGLMVIPTIAVIYYFNKYPSRVFVGDTGTLSMGAVIGALCIVFGLEVIGVITIILPITNAFFSLFSLGRLFERSELEARPIIVKEGGLLEPNLDRRAPITFTRIMLLLGHNAEEELVETYLSIVLLTGLVGIVVSTFLIWR
jgi:UDP-N-acetylmuramyl pentapeptide phosphotransferase/UDP-N-acetylglucosamine-1-phosphate transferase